MLFTVSCQVTELEGHLLLYCWGTMSQRTLTVSMTLSYAVYREDEGDKGSAGQSNAYHLSGYENVQGDIL